jgi:RAD51-like protein 3
MLAKELAKERLDFSSGVVALDQLLDGFGNSRVIEISGDKGSGKTVRR